MRRVTESYSSFYVTCFVISFLCDLVPKLWPKNFRTALCTAGRNRFLAFIFSLLGIKILLLLAFYNIFLEPIFKNFNFLWHAVIRVNNLGLYVITDKRVILNSLMFYCFLSRQSLFILVNIYFIDFYISISSLNTFLLHQ